MMHCHWQNEKQKILFVPKCYDKWAIWYHQRWMGEKVRDNLSNLEYELKTLKYSRDTIETDIKRAIV